MALPQDAGGRFGLGLVFRDLAEDIPPALLRAQRAHRPPRAAAPGMCFAQRFGAAEDDDLDVEAIVHLARAARMGGAPAPPGGGVAGGAVGLTVRQRFPWPDLETLEPVEVPGFLLGQRGFSLRVRWYVDYKAFYRIYAPTEYRFYRSNTGPPLETDSPFATSATLPHEPATTFADGDWWLSVSYFNGVIDSGFLPLGPRGETYRRLRITAGVEVAYPPDAPTDFRLVDIGGGGVARMTAVYAQAAGDRATEWAITYTTNGSTPGTPPAVSPTAVVAIPTSGVALLQFDTTVLGSATVKARLQTRRPSGAGFAYSTTSPVLTVILNTSGPGTSAPQRSRWTGTLPET